MKTQRLLRQSLLLKPVESRQNFNEQPPRRWLAFLLCLPFFLVMACTVSFNLPFEQAGPIQSVEISEPLSSGQPPYQVVLNMGAGQLDLRGDGTGLIEGSVRYNLPDWKPQIIRTPGGVTISQEFSTLFVDRPVNEWNLRLGKSPIDLQIKAGASASKMVLGGVPLTSLVINEGASQTSISFDNPNPETMREFRYTTGGSQVELTGLTNANFKEMIFEGAAGNYTLDFSSKLTPTGGLRQPASVVLKTGVSNLRLVIPRGVPSRIQLSAGINNIITEGTWTINGSLYQTSGDGPSLSIRIETGLGNLTLVNP